MTTTNQWHNDAAEADSQTDLQAQLRAALRANTGHLTDTTGLVRRTLLLERAQICEELARIAVPTSTHTYRKVAAVYRQEADTLNSSTHSDLHDGEGEKAA
ncbi:MAG: hypothetical protein ACRDSI_14825 [Pseudonocardiaceae bacterium]